MTFSYILATTFLSQSLLSTLSFLAMVFGIVILVIVSAALFNRVTTRYATPTDLSGKTVIVTGSNAGLGKESVRLLALMGAHVIMACRSTERGQKALQELRQLHPDQDFNVDIMQLDLGDFDSIVEFVRQYKEKGWPLHVLMNNAGIALAPFQLTKNKFESMWQTNFLGQFLLTELLKDVLVSTTPAARIVNVCSSSHLAGRLVSDADMLNPKLHGRYTAYRRSKLAAVMWTHELSKRMKPFGVSVFAVHPGVVATDIHKSLPGIIHRLAALVLKFVLRSLNQGAQTQIYCATEKGIESQTGQYFQNCRIGKMAAQALNTEETARLWKYAENAVAAYLPPRE